jgi:hypothetical protein
MASMSDSQKRAMSVANTIAKVKKKKTMINNETTTANDGGMIGGRKKKKGTMARWAKTAR